METLGRKFYSPHQIKMALDLFPLPSPGMIQLGRYFVAESNTEIVGSGGWSSGGRDGCAELRAFFVLPSWSRLGIATRLYRRSEQSILDSGRHMIVLDASLSGVPLYTALGFREVGRIQIRTVDGTLIENVRMTKLIRCFAK